MGVQPLLLVVHGRAGGEVPVPLRCFLAELRDRRRASVAVQVLTAGCPSPAPVAPGPLGLVPLLLLPGEHVRVDLPRIRRRLAAAGAAVRPHPFLGAWPAWLEHLAQWSKTVRGDGREPGVLHHPLRSPAGRRYLAMLRQRLGLRLVSAEDAAAEVAAGDSPPFLLPLALAPNRMTDALAPLRSATRDAPRLAAPHLLAHPPSRACLLDLLVRLP